MWGVTEILRSRLFPRAAVLVLVAAGVAACSSDTSRFNDNPFASLSRSDTTGSIPQAPPSARQPISSQPLPSPAAGCAEPIRMGKLTNEQKVREDHGQTRGWMPQ